MRPIKKGVSFRKYTHYSEEKDDLKSTLGSYCSYCETNAFNQVDIEHVVPQEQADTLKNDWSNFLLACKVCNRLKSYRNKTRDGYIFPDTHNTAYAYKYTKTKVTVNQELTKEEQESAQNTLDLVDINRKKDSKNRNDDRLIRSRAWDIALDSLEDYKLLKKEEMSRQIGRGADGFVSSWLEIFKDYPEVKKEILRNTKGTAMECYDEDFNPIKKLER